MPVTVTVYKCGLCGKAFDNAVDAVDCEEKHRVPIALGRLNYDDEYNLCFDARPYPAYIDVDFDDGTVATYGFGGFAPCKKRS